MKPQLCLLPLWLAFWGAPSVSAQAVDLVGVPPPAAAIQGVTPNRPAPAPRAGGSPKVLLSSYGQFVTQVGAGAAGADVSEVETGFSAYGFGMNSAQSARMADDFTVPSGQTWDISEVRWIVYQTGAPTTGTITGMNLDLWSTDPMLGGTPSVSGPPNPFQSQVWTGAYRVTSTTLSSSTRAMIETTSKAAWIPQLSAGTYWMDGSATGSLPAGPFAPVRVPRLASDNARMKVAGTWQAVLDPMSGASQDALIALTGLASTANLTTYCTAKPSSLPNCVPTITGIGEPDCTASRDFVLICGPVPGKALGLFFYTTNGSITPKTTPMGWLCINPLGLRRIPLVSMRPWSGTPLSGGTKNTCDGAYVFDFNRYFAFQLNNPSLICGATVNGQFWYRDPANPAGANFSNAAQFTMTASPPPPPSPQPSGISPTQGGQGTVLTVTGSNFGTSPGDLKLLLADGRGFADVTSAAGTTLTATVFRVGNTGTGPVTLIRGNGSTLPGQTVVNGGITSSSSFVRMIVNAAGTNFSSFNLSPSSPNTVSATSGVPTDADVSLNTSSLSADGLAYRIAFEVDGAEKDFYVFQGRIDFSGTPNADQRAAHFVRHLEASFGPEGLSGSSSGPNVTISMAGSTYGGIVLAGV